MWCVWASMLLYSPTGICVREIHPNQNLYKPQFYLGVPHANSNPCGDRSRSFISIALQLLHCDFHTQNARKNNRSTHSGADPFESNHKFGRFWLVQQCKIHSQYNCLHLRCIWWKMQELKFNSQCHCWRRIKRGTDYLTTSIQNPWLRSTASIWQNHTSASFQTVCRKSVHRSWGHFFHEWMTISIVPTSTNAPESR